MEQEFQTYCNVYNKNYPNAQTYKQRRKQFIRNYQSILSFNTKKTKKGDVTLGINQFADMSSQEYESILGFSVNASTLGAARRSRDFANEDTEYPQLSNPAYINWTEAGAVTPVRNQGQCGSCYAFASAAALESAYKIKTGQLNVFSPQQYVDCSSSYGNTGCSSGNMVNCYSYSKNVALHLESNYPYTGKRGTCQENKTVGFVKNTGYGFVQSRNPQAMINAL